MLSLPFLQFPRLAPGAYGAGGAREWGDSALAPVLMLLGREQEGDLEMKSLEPPKGKAHGFLLKAESRGKVGKSRVETGAGAVSQRRLDLHDWCSPAAHPDMADFPLRRA